MNKIIVFGDNDCFLINNLLNHKDFSFQAFEKKKEVINITLAFKKTFSKIITFDTNFTKTPTEWLKLYENTNIIIYFLVELEKQSFINKLEDLIIIMEGQIFSNTRIIIILNELSITSETLEMVRTKYNVRKDKMEIMLNEIFINSKKYIIHSFVYPNSQTMNRILKNELNQEVIIENSNLFSFFKKSYNPKFSEKTIQKSKYDRKTMSLEEFKK
jgi:hypothetical protein